MAPEEIPGEPQADGSTAFYLDECKAPFPDGDYAEGFTGTAALFARIAALEAENKTLEQELEILRDDLYTARHERAYGGAD